jgi:hypothetical protein
MSQPPTVSVDPSSRLARWLRHAPLPLFSGYAVVASFATYFCVYGFRKPFAAGTYAGGTELWLLGRVDTKVVLIVAQIVGYCLSKFAGIKIVSEVTRARRAVLLALAIALAELALVLFAIAPPSLAPFCLFLNGLPLGLAWGLVFGFLEGRRISDALGAAVCASFIVASGFAKTVGKLVLARGVPEPWMPAATGALFLPPMALFGWLLAQLPEPDAEDERERMRREPMDGPARWRLFLRTAPGLIALIAAYMLFTAYRDFRDNFARELWDTLGYEHAPSVMTTAELPVALGALVAVGLVMAVRDNRRALLFVHALLVAGALLIGVSTLLFRLGGIGPATWMILVGLGLYCGYVPYNCVLFDRLIPALGISGNAGFLIYLADAFGYTGSVLLLLYKTFAEPQLMWLPFFQTFSYVAAIVGTLLCSTAAMYFLRTTR